ncbi:MAG: hypothetical protein ISR58_21675 [Anaerolineales bacterium]|nr:hypothetical protein [Chloroflexota bacterium]MBL6983802.1 hypothetical protein [Anaerolineales bacterium]
MIGNMEAAGLKVENVSKRAVKVDFERWVRMTDTANVTKQIIKTKLLAELNGGILTGMRPFIETDTLKFTQVWAIFIGLK